MTGTDYGFLLYEILGRSYIERVLVRPEGANWKARYKGRWRKVHSSGRRDWIIVERQQIPIQIEYVTYNQDLFIFKRENQS